MQNDTQCHPERGLGEVEWVYAPKTTVIRRYVYFANSICYRTAVTTYKAKALIESATAAS